LRSDFLHYSTQKIWGGLRHIKEGPIIPSLIETIVGCILKIVEKNPAEI
jgi:hypothetical protein